MTNLAKLELEPSLFVKDLDPVVVRIRHNYVVLRVDGDPAGLGELPLEDAELSELAVVDHLLTSDLSLWWIGNGSRWHGGSKRSLWKSRVRDGTGDGRDKFGQAQGRRRG